MKYVLLLDEIPLMHKFMEVTFVELTIQ